MKICFASHNEHKLQEIRRLAPESFSVVGLNDLGLTEEIPEPGKTLEENSAIKAQYVFDKFQIPVFADDSGLEVKMLNGEPGVLSARYAGPQKNSEDNMTLLLENLARHSDRNACFRTIITFIASADQILQFEGQIDGDITKEKRGDEGFGYDPIFVPKGFDSTFAQMSNQEKNAISHRARAFKKFMKYLSEYE